MFIIPLSICQHKGSDLSLSSAVAYIMRSSNNKNSAAFSHQNNASQTNKLSGKLELLALNAGIGLRGGWEDASYFHKVLDVNLFGVSHGLSTLLPLVTASSSVSNPSSIIITGSKQGITNPPGNPAYNASKAAVKTLAEHLSYDLSKSSPTTRYVYL